MNILDLTVIKTNFPLRLLLLFLVAVSPVSWAATPVVDTAISVSKTGSEPFDTNTWQGDGTGTVASPMFAGLDSDEDNNTVRLQDSITYRVEVSVNDSAVDDLVSTVTLNEKQKWITIPTGCKTDPADVGTQPVSSISANGVTLICNLGPAIEGTTKTFFPAARAVGLDPVTGVVTRNDDIVTAGVSSRAFSTDNGTSLAATDGPTAVIVTGFFRVDLQKELKSTATDPDTGAFLYEAPLRDGATGRAGSIIEYTILAKYVKGSLLANGDGDTTAGGLPGLANYRIVDVLTDDNENNDTATLSTGALLYTWDPDQPACELLGAPGAHGDENGPTPPTVTCEQLVSAIDDVGPGGAGPDGLNDLAIQIDLANIDVTDPDNDTNLFEVRLNIWFDKVNDIDSHQVCNSGGQPTCTNTTSNHVGFWDGVSTDLDPFDEGFDDYLVINSVHADGLPNSSQGIVSTEDASGGNVSNYNAGLEPFPNTVDFPLVTSSPGSWVVHKAFTDIFPFAGDKFPDQNMAAGETRPFLMNVFDYRKFDQAQSIMCDKIDTQVFEYAGVAPPNQIGSPSLYPWNQNRPFNPVMSTFAGPNGTTLGDGSALVDFHFTNHAYTADPIAAQAAYITEMRTATCDDDINGDGDVVIKNADGILVDENGAPLLDVNGNPAVGLDIDWWRNADDVPATGNTGTGAAANVTRVRQTSIYDAALANAQDPTHERFAIAVNHLITAKLITASPYGTENRLPNFASWNRQEADGSFTGWRHVAASTEDPTAVATFSIQSGTADRMTLVPSSHSIAKFTDPSGIKVVRGGDSVDFIIEGQVFGLWDDTTSNTAIINDNLPNGTDYIANSEMFSSDGGTTWYTRAEWDARFLSGDEAVELTSSPHVGGADPLRWTFASLNSSASGSDSLPLIKYTVMVDASTVSGTFTNIATINSGAIGGDVKQARYQLTVLPEFGLDVLKSVDQSVYQVNSPFSFDLVYKNLGSEDYSGGEFIDILPYIGDAVGTTGGVNSSREPASSFTGVYEITSVSASNGETFFATTVDPSTIEEDPCHVSNLPLGFDPSVSGGVCELFLAREGALPGGGTVGTNSTAWMPCSALNPLSCSGIDNVDITAIKFSASELIAVEGGQTVTIELEPTGNLGGTPDLDADGNVTAASTGNVYTNTFGGRIAEISFNVISNDVAVTVVAGSIGDTVWFDLDADGNGPVGAGDGSDTAEPPVVGSMVALLDSAGNPVFVDPDTGAIVPADYTGGINAPIPYVDTTDANGMYLFENLPADTYRVVVTPPAGTIPTYDADGIGTPNISIYNLQAETDPAGLLTGVEDNQEQDFGYSAPLQIGSTVWLDANNSGTQDGVEAGIAGVLVQLFNASDDPLTATPVDQVLTDANGDYILNTAAAGDYVVYIPVPPSGVTLSSTLTNVADDNVDSDDNGIQASGGDPVQSPIINLQGGTEPLDALEAGQGGMQDIAALDANGDMTVDFGFYPTGSIGDTIYYDLNGNGTQEPGEAGIGGVTVELTYTPLGAAGPVTISTVTAADGTYLFDDLPLMSAVSPGTYAIEVVTASLPGALGTDLFLTADPDAVDDNTSMVTLTSAVPDDLMQDFGYQPRGSIGDTVWYDANNDGVIDADENGIGGVTITLQPPAGVDADGPGPAVAGEAITAVTDANGNYLFPGLEPGSYTVTVNTATLPSTSYQATYDDDGGDDHTSMVSLTVTTPPTGVPFVSADIDQDFGYVEPVSVGGYVFEDINADGLQTPNEPAVAGSTVSLLVDDGTGTGNFVAATDIDGSAIGSITVGADGQYIFDNLPEGDYEVEITKPTGFKPSPVQNTADDDNAKDDSNIASEPTPNVYQSGVFTLVGGDEPSGSNEDLIGDAQDDAAPAAARDESGNMTVDFGFVKTLSIGSSVWFDENNDGAQDSNEPPLPGTTVALLQLDTASGVYVAALDADGYPVTAVVTGADGLYEFTNLPEGDYKVQVTPPEGVVPSDEQIGANNDDSSNDSNINITADGSDNAAGSIADGTYESGVFTLEFGQEPNEDGASRGDGQDGVSGSASDLNGNMTVDFGFREPELSSLGNYVWLDENSDGLQDAGEPGLAGVTVVLYDDQGNEVARTQTNADGGYLFDELVPGTYYVDVEDGLDGTTDTLPQPQMTQTTTLTNSGADFGNQDHSTTAVPGGPAGQTGYEITLGEGEHNPTADFGYNVNPSEDVNGNTEPASLGDRLWIDSDGDGVQDANEVPVAGAVVSLFTDPDGDGVFDTPYAPNPTQTTDSNGNYLFDDLPADAYVVVLTDSSSASHDILDTAGFAQTGDPDHFAGDASTADTSEAGDNASTRPIVLSPGDVFLNADFGYQPTAATVLGSIGDTIWLDIDADGSGPATASVDGVNNPVNAQGDDAGAADPLESGISGVTVSLIDDLDGNGIRDPGEPAIATAITDENGQYLFDDLVFGDYVVVVDDIENKLAGLSPTYDADGTASTPGSSGVTINAVNPDARDQDFGYTPGTPVGSIGDTIWGDLDNSADDQSNQGAEPGLAGVTVNLYVDEDGTPGPDDLNGDGVIDAADAFATTTTNAAGGYLFDELPLGDYVVEVDDTTLPAGYGPASTYTAGTGVDDAGPAGGDVSPTVSLTAADPHDRDQDFSYPSDNSTATIGDLIWGDLDGDGDGPDTAAATADDLAEPPLAGVTVRLFDSTGAVVATQVTGPDGRYSFTGLDPAATYEVEVDPSTLPAGYQALPTGDPENDGNNTVSVDLNAGDGNADPDGPNGINNGQDFGYPPSSAPTGSIGDTVWFDEDSSGGDQLTQGSEPGLSAVTVTLFTDPNGDGDPSDGMVVEVQTTDENGQYLFQGLPLDDGGGDAEYVVVVDTDSLPNYVNPVSNFDADGGSDSSSSVALNPLAPTNTRQDFSYPPVDSTTQTAALGDTVFIDNGDTPSVQNANDTVLEGVVVNLLVDTNSDGIADRVVGTAVTDADGKYLFLGLDPEQTYTVQVVASNFDSDGPLEGLTNTVDPDGGDINSSTVDFSAQANKVDLDQDFGFIAATPVDVGNLVWLDKDADGVYEPNGLDGIAGTDDDETPIGGVSLELYRDLNDNGVVDPGEPLFGTQTTSNAIDPVNGSDGNYIFFDLPADNYVIKVSDEANVLEGYWQSEGSSNLDGESQVDSYAVDATAGDNFTADFGYYVEPGSIGDVIWEDLNGDGLYDPATEPGIDGVTVNLTITYPDGTVTELTTVTEYGGKYQFDNLLLDEDFNGVTTLSYGDGGDEPAHLVTLDQTSTPTELGAIYNNFPASTDTVNVGGNVSDEDDQDVGGDDGVAGEPAFPPMGGIDPTNDFGFSEAASLGNRVWLDLDMDGVQDANEDGIANVTVNLLDSTGATIATTTTGPNGEYLFTDLTPGLAYSVMVDSATLPTGLVQTFDEGPSGAAGVLDHTSAPVVLLPGEEHLTADFGYATPTGTGAIGDRVWVDVDADGMQDAGELGLGNVIVSLTPPPDVDLGNGLGVAITTMTDSAGNYLFTGLPLNETYIVEVDRSTVPSEYADVPNGLGDPDVRDGNSAAADDQTIVVLTSQAPVNLDSDFGYLPNDPSVNNAIGGTIWNDVDEDGNGPAGAGDESDVSELSYAGVTVTLFNSAGEAVASTVTGADGSYLFEGLPDDTYTVLVTDANNVLNSMTETSDFDGIATPGTSNVSVAGGQTNLEQDFAYVDNTPTGGSGDGVIGDTVFFDQNGSGLPDPGEAIEGVTVQLYGSGPDGILGNADDVLLGSTVTDENGNYLFTGLDTSDTGSNPGTDYQVVVDTSTLPNGAAGWDNTVDPDTAGLGDNESVTTLTTAAPSDLDQDFGYTSDDNNSIQGTVWPDTNGDGTQAEAGGFGGVTLVLLDDDGDIIATTTTDMDGNYEFTGLPDGVYTVVVTDDDNVLNGFEHTDSPGGLSDAGDSSSKDDTGYTVDLDSAGTVSTPVIDVTSDFGYMPIVTNPISLGSFNTSSVSEGQVLIQWTTQTEVANLGFKLYGRVDDEWVLLNETLILGQGDSVSTQRYESTISTEAVIFAIADVDLTGTETLHGPFRLGKSYGGESKAKVIDWAAEKAAREQKSAKRAAKRMQQQNVRKLKRMQKLIKRAGD